MDAEEIARLIGELENRVERLRSLYEQYFMGIERLEPLTLRKDVERRLWTLRREQIRNTGLRFKLETTIQRYNTYQQYWQRIVREIEQGTYQRDIGRAAQRFGENVVTAFARRRQKMYEKGLEKKAERNALRRTGPVANEDLPDDALEEAPPSSNDYDVMFEDSENAGPAARPAPPPPPPPPPPAEPYEPLELEISEPAPPVPPRRQAPWSPGAAARPAEPAKAPSAPQPAVSATAPTAARPGGAPIAPTAARPGAAALPAYARPGAGGIPPAYAKPPAPGPALGTAARPAAPAAPAPPPARPPLASSPEQGLPQSPPMAPAAKPASPLSTTAKAASPPATPAKPAAPAPPAARPPAASRPDAPPAAVLSDDNGLSPIRMRQIYGAFVEAKRKANESTATVTYEKIASNLESVAKELRAKHKARSVDFEVVMKNGKPVLKPVVKG